MTDVMTELNKLYEVLKKKDTELDRLITNSKEIRERQEKIQADQDAREVQLGERELKIGKIENVVVFKKEAERLLQEAQEITQKIQKDKADFTIWLNNEKEGVARARLGVDSCNEALKKREDEIEAEKKKLALDKVTYREHIIREIGKMTNAANS